MVSSNPTEIMCDDRHKKLFVIPFIKNQVNTMENGQPITFIDLNNDKNREYKVPGQQS